MVTWYWNGIRRKPFRAQPKVGRIDYWDHIIMWEINSQEQPFPDIQHDTQLALQICQGRRPKITTNKQNSE